MARDENGKWINPKKQRGSWREYMDRRLERAGLLNYQTQGLSQQEIADRYARSGITIAPNTQWFSNNYGFEAPEYITDRQKMYEYRRNPGAFLPNIFPSLDTKIVPAGGKADRPQNFMVGTDPLTGKPVTTTQTITPTLTNANSPYAPMAFGTQQQAQQGEINWTDLSTSDRQKILNDPNFYKSGQIAQYQPWMQQQILADPNFKWENLPKLQRAYYEFSSNPAAMGGTQGALMGAGGGKWGGIGGAVAGAILGWAAGISGYDPTKEAWEQGDKRFTLDKGQAMEAVRGAFGYLNWAAEQMEKTIGLGFQIAGAAADPNRDVKELFDDFESTWHAGAITGEVIGNIVEDVPRMYVEWFENIQNGMALNDAAAAVLNRRQDAGGLLTMVLGSSVPVSAGGGIHFEPFEKARKEIQSGRNYREVMMELQNSISSQIGDMVVQATADPLNFVGPAQAKIGEVTARVTGDSVAAQAFRGASGFTDAQARLRNIINTPGEAAKIDPNFRVDQMGWLTKSMAGLTSEGKVRAGKFGDAGLLDYKPPKRNLRGFVDYLTNMTPESRARTGQDLLLRNVGNVMAAYFRGADVDGFSKWWKAFSNGDMTQAAELSSAMMGSPEFYTVLPAAKNFDIDAQYAKWAETDQPRQSVTRIADLLGENPMTLIEDLARNGTAEQDMIRIRERLAKMDTPEARAMLAEIETGRFTPEMLASAVNIFSNGDVPFHPSQWMAQTLDAIKQHYDEWAIQHFRLDEESRKTLFRVSAVLKGMQSILLLGANPGYMLQNVLNTTVTRAFDGTWGYMTPKAIDDFMTKMGFDLKEGLAPSRLDESGPKMQDIQRGETDKILDAVKGKGTLTRIQDGLQKVARVMPFNKFSRVLEGAEGRQGYVIGAKQFMGENWRRGRGFRNVPAPLANELTRVLGRRGVDLLQSAIESAHTKADIQAIMGSVGTNLKSRALLHDAAQRLNIPSTQAAKMLEQMGILDAIDNATRSANSEARVRRAFERAKREAKIKLDEQAAADAVANIEHVANRLNEEGAKAITDIILNTEEKGIEQWLQHYERMGEAADAMDTIDNPATRAGIWAYKYAESSAEYRRYNAHRASTYMGVMKAVGLENNPTARQLLATMADTDRTMDNAYKTMRTLRDEHFRKWNSDWDNPRRQVERSGIEAQIEQVWREATRRELENSGQFGELLGRQYDELFGVEAGEAARQAWEQITEFRREMTQRRDAFRKSIEALPYAQRQIESRKFWGETYKYMIAEMERIKTEAIMTLDDIANNRRRGDEGEAPAPTEPTPPDQPPAAPAVDMQALRQAAEQRQAGIQERVTSMWEAAEQFGYNRDKPYAFMATMRKYGDADLLHYDDPRLTPEYVTETLQRREQIKAEQQARQERNAAEIAINRAEQDAVQTPRHEIPESISNALEAEARRITDVVLGGEPGRRIFADGQFVGATASTYPKWYNDLQASVGGRKKLLAALDKIVEDRGKDKGVVVARVKEFLLGNIKYGDDATGSPPNLRVLYDLGADDATLRVEADNFNEMMGTNFTLEQMLADDYSSAFGRYFDEAMTDTTPVFDPARWEADVLGAFDELDFARLTDLIEEMPAEIADQPYNVTGETYGDFVGRVWDDATARLQEQEQALSVAEGIARSENAIRAQEEAAEMGFTRQQFRDSLTEVFRLSDEEADAVLDITDARANAYGDAADWYRTRIAEVVGAGDIDLAQEVYHGSPHKFDKFTLDKIGSGEGAQAYGWGLYFAGDKAVAEWYRINLTYNRDYQLKNVLGWIERKQKLIDQGGFYRYKNEKGIIVSEVDFQDPRRAQRYKEEFVKYSNAELKRHAADLKRLEVDAENIRATGQLYKVEIPDDGYLLWDRPLSEQPEVKSKIDQMMGFTVRDDWTGEVFYRNAKREFGDQKAASLALKEAGLNGIKYLDGSSRGKGDGSYNYVIFDDAAIDILETYYQRAEAQPGAAKGGVRFLEDGRAIIRAFQQADVSTVIHEVAHIFRRDLQGGDLAIMEDWAGVKNGQWTRAAEEKFARGFERYMADGSAPTLKLRGVFEKFRQWMTNIYRAINGSPIDVEIPPAVREVFDRMLGAERRADFDPNTEWIDTNGVIRQKEVMKLTVDQEARRRASQDLLGSDFMQKLKEQAAEMRKKRSTTPPDDFVSSVQEKLQQLERTPERTPERADPTIPVPDRNTPAWQMTYEQYKALLLDDQRAYARRELDGESVPSKQAKLRAILESNELSYARYGDVRETWRQKVEQALADDQAVPDDIKQAFYEMGKAGELSAAEMRRLRGAGRDAGELFQMAEPTDSPEFKRWFGDGKVVDEYGRPLVVYHGTKSDIQVFDKRKAGVSDPGLVGKAFYFTPSPEQAGDFAINRFYGKGNQPNVMPVYLQIENPYVVADGILPDGRRLTEVYPQGIEKNAAATLQKEIKRLGHDGVIFTLDGDITQVAAFEPTQIKSVANRGTWDPTNPNILFQDADPRMPLGGYEEAAGWMPQGEAMNELWAQEINPLLEAMEETAVQRLNEPTMEGAYRDMSAEGQEMLRNYLKGVEQDLASTKMGAMRWGQYKRDQSLLNYNRRYGFDQMMDVVFPYQFFYTRSMITWAARALDTPAILANYARLRRQQDRYENNLPERLRGKMRIEAPWLPEWMGGGVYIDPLNMLFTPHSLMRPFEQMMKDTNMQYVEAERILQEWAQDERMPMDALQEAATTRSGKVWEQALAEAEMRREAEISNPMDFITATFGPAWYLSTPAKLMGLSKDGPETVGELPLTRTARALETVTKDTWMEPAGKVLGLLAKPEEWAREKLNLPEMGEYGDYYIDRQLANMVAEGLISTEDAIIAMVEREGDLFEQARERTKLELAVRVPLAGAVYAMAHGGPVEGLKALPASLFGAMLLPEGELIYRGQKQEWNDAWKLKDAGDEDAINRFFAENPEYEAYLAKGKEPEDRLRSFLIGQIWDGYMGLGETNRRQARSEMGDEFANAFLNKETRSYDTLSIETLTQWAQMLNQRVPKTPETLPAIEQPRTIDYYDKSVTDITDTYYEQRKKLYPEYFELERRYYALPKSQQRSFLVANPSLKQYWDWKRAWYDRYPQLVPVFNGQVFKRVDTENWNPILIQSVQMYAMLGQPMSSGAWKALEQQWIRAGRPRESVKDWLEIDVAPAMMYGP